MLEELKFLGELLQKFPETALWVLGGFALYKVVMYLSMTGSITFVLKLLIEKAHDAYVRKVTKPEAPPPPKEVTFLEGQVISHDGTRSRLERILRQHLRNSGNKGIISTHIHSCDVDWFEKAILEKKAREKKNDPS